MNVPVAADSRLFAPWLRLSGLGLAMLAVILVPFALWGEVLDAAAPGWMQAQDARLAIAALGIALLIADVLLPVPGSVVAVALCWSLGPWWGGTCVALGYLLAFVTGYGLGRLVPELRLRAWIGPRLWDRTRTQARQRALWWIVAARPLPVLSELSALLAGVLRVPLRLALPCAAAASIAVGALYGYSVQLGRGEPGLAAMLLAMCALPAALWLVHRIVLRRVLADTAEPPPAITPNPVSGSES